MPEGSYTARDWAIFAQQALDNPAIRRARDELKEAAIQTACYDNGADTKASERRAEARRTLAVVELIEGALLDFIAAGPS